MLPDFEMIAHHVEGNDDVTVLPIADIHLGAREHMTRQWEQFCQNVLSQPRVYLILAGDLINNATRSSVSNIFDEAMRPREQKQIKAKMLEPLKPRILCAVPGNHERRSVKDADDEPTYDILCKLDLEHLYRENIAFVKVQVGKLNSSGKYNPTYVMAVSHGAGGGMLPGATINRNERFAYAIDGADALIVGHSHKPMVSQPGKLRIDARNNVVRVVPTKVIVASSWLEYGGYAAQKMLLPTTHTRQIITLRGHRKEIRVEM